MKNRIATFLLALLAVCAAQAHFTFVVPQEGGAAAKMFMSETLTPDLGVDVGMIGDTKLGVRDARGREHPLTFTRAEGNYFTAPVPGNGTRVLHGFTDLGVMSRSKVHLLLYYPKSIFGNAFDPKTRVGDSAVAELVPVGRPGDFKLLLTGRGKPLADSEITVVHPDGKEEIVTTDSSGHTKSFTAEGQYGAWARFWEDAVGEREGKEYQQVRHYATLVFNASEPKGEMTSALAITARKFGTMPEKTSSFGAAVSDGWLYVYGGHIAPTHVYSTQAVSGKFHRMPVDGSQGWEELPSGPALQGMNIAAHKGMIYRIGGMAPKNSPDEPTDNRSIAGNSVFDTKRKAWKPLPDLPAPRSSHDIAVIGDTLLVIGGWTMREGGQDWSETMLSLDLSKKKAQWESHPVPFKRRALMAADFHGKMYVVGGFSDKNEVQRAVSIYDPESASWSDGPDLPEGDRTAGFAPAVGVHGGRLYVSISDGTLYRLSESGDAWENAGASTPRLAHRLVSSPKGVLILGGAADGDNFDLVEAVRTGS